MLKIKEPEAKLEDYEKNMETYQSSAVRTITTEPFNLSDIEENKRETEYDTKTIQATGKI